MNEHVVDGLSAELDPTDGHGEGLPPRSPRLLVWYRRNSPGTRSHRDLLGIELQIPQI